MEFTLDYFEDHLEIGSIKFSRISAQIIEKVSDVAKDIRNGIKEESKDIFAVA